MTVRKRLIAGNWKMHGDRESVTTLVRALTQHKSTSQNEIVVMPPFIYIPLVAEIINANSHIKLGAQNLADREPGAYTGEVAAQMLVDYGCHYVIIGHSERRHYLHETDDMIFAKYKLAQKAGLTPILCVGETGEERKQGATEEVISKQLCHVLSKENSHDYLKNTVIAYEPVWAIGTGVAASPEDAEAVHAFIRQKVMKFNSQLAHDIRIIYGGSVKASNASAIFAMENIDGGLIGGASLNAEEFLGICQCNN